MGKKIFISYKYADNSVHRLNNQYNATVRDYVNYLETKIDRNNIYKGEHDGEDLSEFKDETIRTKLKDKIFDSSITIVLISPNMKEIFEDEKNQWIPWEISYSLRTISRYNGNKKSLPNAIINVVLPDKWGLYDYYIDEYNIYDMYNKEVTFNIINKNNNNNKFDISDSYIVTVKWESFIKNINYYIDKAVEKQNKIDKYDIKVQID